MPIKKVVTSMLGAIRQSAIDLVRSMGRQTLRPNWCKRQKRTLKVQVTGLQDRIDSPTTWSARTRRGSIMSPVRRSKRVCKPVQRFHF